MNHEDFDPYAYERLDQQDKLKLVEQIAKSLKLQMDEKVWDIEELQSQIEDLEFDLENLRTEQQPFLKERRRLRIALGLEPVPGQINLFSQRQ
ncbi:MAG: hypothetical protein HC851_20180 [Acaryochloris sp. RU_4_1]|nr:hypothetical protein [Acaryochloris sp. RU_4_1]NJR56518.1 hypothetical protein [Acaryochloris sp. CRU_2_0]